MTRFVCPDCKGELVQLNCAHCNHQYASDGGFASLLTRAPAFSGAQALVDVYDQIYSEHSGVWVNQGRTPAFIDYFSQLVARYAPKTLLEIGCGEGVLLRALRAERKWATDLASSALAKTASGTAAELCIALGESLPFPDQGFDVVVSVGVMEHFVDDLAASREILRVTRAGGHYIVLIHIHLTVWQSIGQKIAEYVFPRPRPIALAKWIKGKFYKRIDQPIQNPYTIASVQQILERAGFKVQEVIHRGSHPQAPLIGPHVIIYVCEKPAGA